MNLETRELVIVTGFVRTFLLQSAAAGWISVSLVRQSCSLSEDLSEIVAEETELQARWAWLRP